MSIAGEYEQLAADSREVNGYVTTDVFRLAGTAAIGGRKTENGYEYEFEDGSWASIDKRRNQIKEMEI